MCVLYLVILCDVFHPSLSRNTRVLFRAQNPPAQNPVRVFSPTLRQKMRPSKCTYISGKYPPTNTRYHSRCLSLNLSLSLSLSLNRNASAIEVGVRGICQYYVRRTRYVNKRRLMRNSMNMYSWKKSACENSKTGRKLT